MDKTMFCKLILLYFILGNAFSIEKRELIKSPTTEGEVTCFSEYMETCIHSAKGEELGVWLSETLQIEVSLASLDHLNLLNLQLSSCGFSLHKDLNKNFLFRASYSGCFVQHQHGYHVLILNLKKRTNRFRGRSLKHILKCPVVSVLPHRKQIQCDPEFIQVTREVPYVNRGNELQWYLSLGNNLIVALEDASLIQMNTVLSGTNITVQGRRKEVMNPVKVCGNVGEFLALKLVSGQYAYSMEAICPTVPNSIKEDTVLHILKRHMGLTKRGSHDPKALTVSSVSVNQTDRFSVQETSGFVRLTIPTAQILQTKACADRTHLLQLFYRVDVVLSFKETNQEMQWSIENTLPCTAGPAVSHGVTSSPGPSDVPLLSHSPVSFTVEQSHSLSTVPALMLQDRADEKTADFSTTETLHTQMENSTSDLHMVNMSTSPAANASVVFGGDDAASINVTERTPLDFLNVTMNAEPAFFEAPTTAKPLESSAEPQYQQVTTSSGDQDHQEQLKSIW